MNVKVKNSTRQRKHGFLLLSLCLFLNGCASTYQIHSMPEGATVYYNDPATQRKIYLGTTPLSFSKSGLPTEQAFMLTVAKEGFKPSEIPMMSTDESKSLVKIDLKPDEHNPTQDAKEWNEAILKLFEAQRLIYQRQFHAAIIELEKVIKQKPTLVEAHVLKGTSYYLLGEVDSAKSSWRVALKIAPGNPELLRFLDEMKIRIQDLEVKP